MSNTLVYDWVSAKLVPFLSANRTFLFGANSNVRPVCVKTDHEAHFRGDGITRHAMLHVGMWGAILVGTRSVICIVICFPLVLFG